MEHGAITTKLARALLPGLHAQGYDVLYGHGQTGTDPSDRLGKIKSWFGSNYEASAVLADLDVAIVSRQTDQLIALIEIEETASTPKVLLGDVLAALLGSQITFQGKRHLRVGGWTTLIVTAHSTNPSHRGRIAFLEQQANHLKTKLATPNASIGRVVIDSFQNELELEQKLRQHIQDAVPADTGTQQLST